MLIVVGQPPITTGLHLKGADSPSSTLAAAVVSHGLQGRAAPARATPSKLATWAPRVEIEWRGRLRRRCQGATAVPRCRRGAAAVPPRCRLQVPPHCRRGAAAVPPRCRGARAASARPARHRRSEEPRGPRSPRRTIAACWSSWQPSPWGGSTSGAGTGSW